MALKNLLAFRNLSRHQIGFHEFALAADDHGGELLEPPPRRHVRLSVEPRGQQSELAGGDAALLNAVEEMLGAGPAEGSGGEP